MKSPEFDFRGSIIAGAAVGLFSLLLLWRNPLLFWNDDYELSILPVFADVARSWSEGNFPLLSPYSWVCSNLAGEFQYGTFSLFVNAAVVVIWKFSLTFAQQAAALSIVHLIVLAMGGYLLARGRNLNQPLSTMVAFVAALNGWIVCWGAIDWFGALGAFAWLPWAWWALERARDPARGRWRFVYPAPFVYLLVTGGFPYTVVMLGLLVVWLMLKEWVQTRRVSACVPLGVGTALGFGLAAPAWLGLFAYVHGSAREAQEAASHFQWIVPPAALPAFILPGWTVNWADFSTRLMPHTATEMASGLVPPAALIAGLIIGRNAFARRVGWELTLLGAVLMISMLPSANVFRWSFRWLPFLHVILALCAAEALQFISQEDQPIRTRTRWLSASSVGLLLAAATGAVMWILGLQGAHGTLLAACMLGLTAVWSAAEYFGRSGCGPNGWAAPGFAAAILFATYLCIPPNGGVPRYELSQQLNHPEPLDPARLYLSAYPAPEHVYRLDRRSGPVGEVTRLGSTSMWGAVRLLNGYSPIRPSGVARKYNFGIHGEIDYSAAERLLASESGRDQELDLLGVDGIIVAQEFQLRPQPESEWETAHSAGEGTVFHRKRGPHAAARSVSAEAQRTYAAASVTVAEDTRNEVAAEVSVPADGPPALIVFSRPFFNGYRASLGDRTIPVVAFRGLAPAVEVPAGFRGRLRLRYFPNWLSIGAAIAAISLLIHAIGICALFRTKSRAPA